MRLLDVSGISKFVLVNIHYIASDYSQSVNLALTVHI